jgi:peptide chain release factor subunit 1
MAVPVTWQTLRELAQFRTEHGCAVSVFLDLDPSASPTPAAAATRFESLFDELEKTHLSGEKDGDRKRAVRADLERLRIWFDEEYSHDGARGFAVYASNPDGYFRALPLSRGVPDHASLDSVLEVAPLVDLVGADSAFVAVIDREHGNLYRVRPGRLEEVVDETDDDVPGRHSKGGWSQARYQRHIEWHIHEHLKTVGDEIDRRVRRAHGPQLVIVAAEELRPEIESVLPNDVRDTIVGWTTAESHAGPEELFAVAQPYFDQARAEQEEEALAHWHEAMGTSERGVAGWADTLAAASDARVAELLVASGTERTAYRCPQDGRAYAEAGECPLDGTPLEAHDGIDLAVHQTLLHGGTVLTVDGDPLGGEGIGALLRY